ncbi:MAG: hypothetical protein PGN23_15220 [Sphingomonas adhaesiva]
MELRLVIAYLIIAAFVVGVVIGAIVFQRRRAARRLRMRGVKVDQRAQRP